MTSEIRANTIKNRVGLGTVSFTNTGSVVSGIVTANTLRLPDSTSGSFGRVQLGNGLDLSLFHDGSNSFLINNTGYLSIQSQDGVNGIFIARNAEVNLYFGSSVRLQTSSSGVTINRDLDVDGHTNLDNVSVAGVSTFTGAVTAHDYRSGGGVGNTLYLTSADDWRFRTTGGAEKVRIKSNGNVGIGSDTPGRALTITNAEPRIRLQDADTGGHAEIYTDNNHNLQFSADSSSSSGSSQFFFRVNGTEKVRIQEDGDIIYGPGDHIIGGDPALIQGQGSHHNNNIGTITYGINDGGNTCGMRVENFDDGTYNAQRVKFLTAKGGYSMATVRMTIDENGKVGIGTNPAYAKLESQTGTETNSDTEYYGEDFAIAVRANKGNNAGDEGNGIVFTQKWDVASPHLVRTGAILGYKQSGTGNFGGGLIFKTQGHGASPMSEKLRITSDGKVGINQTSPTCQLQIDSGSSGAGTVTHLELNHKGNDTNDAVKLNFARAGSDIGSIVLEKVASNNTTDFIFNTRSYNTVSESMRITGGGKVGIGTNNPATKLHIFDSSADPYLKIGGGGRDCGIQLDANTNFTAFRTDAANRLYVNAGADSIRFTIGGTTTANEKLRITSTGQTKLNISANAALTEPLVIRNGGTGGGTNVGMVFYNGNESNTGAGALAKIKAIDVGNYDSDLVFETGLKSGWSDGGTTERLRITSTGNIGIGIDTPAAKLEAYGADAAITVHYSSHSRGGIAAFTNQRLAFVSTHVNDDLIFGYSNNPPSTANLVERMRIDNGTGNVVIGHTAANAKLHIASGTSSAVGDATNPAFQIGNTSNYRFAIHTTSEQAIIANKNGDDGIAFHTKTAGGSSFGQALLIDANSNLKHGTTTPTAFTDSAPSHTQRFLSPKCMQGCVSDTVTLDSNGNGTFDLGRLWITDDTSIELFIQVVRNDSGNYTTHYAKAFIQKVRGSGMSNAHILYQNGAAASNGFSISSIFAGGYTGSGHSSHGTRVSVTGGAGGVIYRLTCFYTAISKNNMY